MPRFRSDSGSLRKMELVSGREKARTGNFSMANVIGDPFSLATLGIAACGWIIAFASSVVADISLEYPNFAWWTLAYMFCCIIGIFVAVATDTTHTYHVAIVGFMAAGLVFTTSSVNSLIYFPNGSKEAAAAGFILLSMVAIVWILYYGSEPSATHRQTIDSFALHKDGRVPSRGPSQRGTRHMTQSYLAPETRNSGPQVVNSAALVGFENSSPVTGYPSGRVGEPKPTDLNSSGFATAGAPMSTQQQQHASFMGASQQDSGASQPAEYPYRAKAIYSYEANPDDANEISFSKHEVLEVSDVSGRWWQAKKENGETGIAPSNYLILL